MIVARIGGVNRIVIGHALLLRSLGHLLSLSEFKLHRPLMSNVCPFSNPTLTLDTQQMKSWSVLCALVLAVVHAKETIMIPMRDGVKLATDVHKPDGTNALPVILA